MLMLARGMRKSLAATSCSRLGWGGGGERETKFHFEGLGWGGVRCGVGCVQQFFL